MYFANNYTREKSNSDILCFRTSKVANQNGRSNAPRDFMSRRLQQALELWITLQVPLQLSLFCLTAHAMDTHVPIIMITVLD